jgi:hypothetical protein
VESRIPSRQSEASDYRYLLPFSPRQKNLPSPIVCTARYSRRPSQTHPPLPYPSSAPLTPRLFTSIFDHAQMPSHASTTTRHAVYVYLSLVTLFAQHSQPVATAGERKGPLRWFQLEGGFRPKRGVGYASLHVAGDRRCHRRSGGDFAESSS